MGSASFLQSSFHGGEWAPSAQGAITDPRYKISMSACLNGLPMETGAWGRRPGTQFSSTTRSGSPGKIISFDFKENTPYNMEFTDGFLRFHTGASLVMTNDQQAVTSITSVAIPAYDSLVTYSIGQQVSYNSALYVCASPSGPPGVTPGTNAFYWTYIAPLVSNFYTQVTTAHPHGWQPSSFVAFNGLGTNNPTLQNRIFFVFAPTASAFILLDGVAPFTQIDGATVGAFVSGNVTRVLEMPTIYTAGRWANVRSVQAEKKTVLMNGTQRPQLLSVTALPVGSVAATFTLDNFDFHDGPYLDPIAGTLLTPTGTNGVISLTLSTQGYSSSTAYNKGDFVTYVGVNYKSLIDINQGNTPAGSPSAWLAVSAGAAVGPNGFQDSDVGRSVRLFSEPTMYNSSSGYVTGNVVSYPDLKNGVNLYYRANATIGPGIIPGTSTLWALAPTFAQWTWGTITAVSGVGIIPPVVAIGNMVDRGGNGAAFDGNPIKSVSASATFASTFDAASAWVDNGLYTASGPQSVVRFGGNLYVCVHTHNVWESLPYPAGAGVEYFGAYFIANMATSAAPGVLGWTNVGPASPNNTAFWQFAEVAPTPTISCYVGQNYSVAKAIDHVTLTPTTDNGFANTPGAITFNLRASNIAPATSGSGALLGSLAMGNTYTPITIPSSDRISTWNYVWVEISAVYPAMDPTAGAGFSAFSSVAQMVLYAPNASNGSIITLQIRGIPLLYAAAINTWRLGVYSDTTGWPTCGVYHEGRLWLSGAVSNRIDSSVAGDILDFAPTSNYGAVSDSNAISYTFDATDVNAIFWGEQDQAGIIWGTQAGEWLVQATTLNQPLTPTSIQAHRVTKIGCANIEPRRTDHTLVFVQKFGRKVMEYFADVFSGKFSAPNLVKNSKHITVTGISQIAYQQELSSIVWMRCTNGQLSGITYQRDSLVSAQGPTINGVHRHMLGSGRGVESMCVGPSIDGNLDALSMLTNDPVTGIRHVEVMTNIFQETDTLLNSWHLDDAAAPSSYTIVAGPGAAPSLKLNGLWHLNGETVTVFAGGLDVGDWPVAAGSAVVAFSPSGQQSNTAFTQAFVAGFASQAMPCVVGFTYTSQGQLLRPDTQPEGGARNGPGFGKIRRIHKFAALLTSSWGLSFGVNFTKMKPATFKTPGGTAALPVGSLFSGIYKDAMNDDAEGFASQLAWEISRPFPAIVAGISGFIETTDE